MEQGEDGFVYFEGFGTAEVTDGDGEVVDFESVAKCMDDYMTRANVRDMHQLNAIGKVLEWSVKTIDGAKGIWLKGKVVDPVAITKCIERVYNGISIGARTLAKEGSRIFVKRINEYSLVDDPACPVATAVFSKLMDTEEVGMPEVKKSLFMVAQGAQILDMMAGLRAALQGEMEREGHMSPVASKLDADLKSFGETVKALTVEEVDEATGAKPDEAGDEGGTPLSEDAKLARQSDLEKASKAAKELALSVHKELTDMAAKLAEAHKLEIGSTCKECAAHKDAVEACHKEMGDVLDAAKEAMHPNLHAKLSAVHAKLGEIHGKAKKPKGDGKTEDQPADDKPADDKPAPDAPNADGHPKADAKKEDATPSGDVQKLSGQVSDLQKVIAEKDAEIAALKAKPEPDRRAVDTTGLRLVTKENDGGSRKETPAEAIAKVVASDAPAKVKGIEVIKLSQQNPNLVRVAGHNHTQEAE